VTKERKIILIAGALLIFFGVLYRFMPDVQSLLVSDDEIDMKMKKLSQHSLMITKQANHAQRNKAIAKLLKKTENGLLKGKTPVLASVDLQNTIKGVVYKAGIELKSFQVLDPGDPDSFGYVDIPVRFQVTSSIRQLKDILYGIEASRKFLRVKEINSRTSRGKPKGNKQVKIRSIITVVGYVVQ